MRMSERDWQQFAAAHELNPSTGKRGELREPMLSRLELMQRLRPQPSLAPLKTRNIEAEVNFFMITFVVVGIIYVCSYL